MKIILLKDVPKIGRRGDIKNISDGYARNFLLPNGFARLATEATIKEAAIEKIKDLDNKKKELNLIKSIFEKFKDFRLTIKEKASEAGHLFAGIDEKKIVKALVEAGVKQIDLKNIKLAAPIKQLGEYDIEIEKEQEKGMIKLIIEAEN